MSGWSPNLALYRRYRPETFAEVIGQDHVTEPLRSALANNRVNHAYLFSGPRGCGKTTSARILARTLNCEKAPVADPCGECRSCQDLARGGPGSVDVIEIDAASHGGVDDARDLRERAFFAPVSSRYKVYIIDEAHMVSTQGFNALLKLVEEPPEHLRFIFATTEPEKVIPTIRSRTHHYPFRLIPPRVLSDYLAEICDQRGRQDRPGRAAARRPRRRRLRARLPLRARPAHRRARAPTGVTYDVATGLLGYTPDNLLDEVVDAFAAARRVRRLRRRRQGDRDRPGPSPVHRGRAAPAARPRDRRRRPRRARVRSHRRARGPGRAARRPGRPVRQGRAGARRRHRRRRAHRDARGDDAAAAARAGLRARAAAGCLARRARVRCAARAAGAARRDGRRPLQRRRPRRRRRSRAPSAGAVPDPVRSPQPAPSRPRAASRGGGAGGGPGPPPSQSRPHAAAPGAAEGQLSLADVRRIWPDLLEQVKQMRRFTWILLSQNAQVIGVDAQTLTVGFKNAGARDSFLGGGSEEILRQAAIDMIGADWKVETVVDPGAQPGAETAPRVTEPAVEARRGPDEPTPRGPARRPADQDAHATTRPPTTASPAPSCSRASSARP